MESRDSDKGECYIHFCRWELEQQQREHVQTDQFVNTTRNLAVIRASQKTSGWIYYVNYIQSYSDYTGSSIGSKSYSYPI